MGIRRFYGGCPVCGRQDGYVIDDGQAWAVCDTHRMKWPAGSGGSVGTVAQAYMRKSLAAEMQAREAYRAVDEFIRSAQ